MKRVDLPNKNSDINKSINGFKDLSTKFNLNKWIKILLIIITIFIINFIASHTLWGGQDFYSNWSSARALLIKGINPYSQYGMELLIESLSNWHVIPTDTNISFIDPLFSLFLFFPFSIINNFYLARAFWLIINEAFLILSSSLALRIIGLQDDQQVSRRILFYFFGFFYSIIALLQGSEYIFLFFIFLGALHWIHENKFLETGVLLAILSFKMQALFPLLLVLFVYLIIKKGWSAFFWYFISLGILIVASYLLIPDWPVMYFRAIITNGISSGIALPGALINNWISNSTPLIWNGISIISFGIILFELFLFPIDLKRLLWILCLAITLYPLMMIQSQLSVLCFLLLPMSYIFRYWIERNRQVGLWVLNLSLLFFSIFLLLLGIFTKSMDYKEPFSAVFYFLPIFFSLLNLYWIRGWVKIELIIR